MPQNHHKRKLQKLWHLHSMAIAHYVQSSKNVQHHHHCQCFNSISLHVISPEMSRGVLVVTGRVFQVHTAATRDDQQFSIVRCQHEYCSLEA